MNDSVTEEKSSMMPAVATHLTCLRKLFDSPLSFAFYMLFFGVMNGERERPSCMCIYA